MLYELLFRREIEKDSDTIIYMASHILFREAKSRSFKPLSWQITSLALSEWISRNWDINQCLSFISNRSYYGNGYYGLVEASRAYFGKPSDELNADEICMLIATTLAPTRYNPTNKNERFVKKSEEIKNVILRSKNWK
jgi:membrane carboxypeptidase/penicillin-binding protein